MRTVRYPYVCTHVWCGQCVGTCTSRAVRICTVVCVRGLHSLLPHEEFWDRTWALYNPCRQIHHQEKVSLAGNSLSALEVVFRGGLWLLGTSQPLR